MCEPCAVKSKQDQQQQAQNKKEQQKQKYKDALVDTYGEFIKTSVIGIIIGFCFAWFMKSNVTITIGEVVAYFFVEFCIPFGWKFLTYLQSFIPLSLIGTFYFWIIYTIVKAILSSIVGIPAFIYQLVKTILAQRKINKLN